MRGRGFVVDGGMDVFSLVSWFLHSVGIRHINLHEQRAALIFQQNPSKMRIFPFLSTRLPHAYAALTHPLYSPKTAPPAASPTSSSSPPLFPPQHSFPSLPPQPHFPTSSSTLQPAPQPYASQSTTPGPSTRSQVASHSDTRARSPTPPPPRAAHAETAKAPVAAGARNAGSLT